MRKQTDFDIRVFDVTGAGMEGGMTHEQVSEFVREGYLNKGWEVLSSEVAQISANHVFFAVSLVKYVDVLEPTVAPEVVAKRGPGRPKSVTVGDDPTAYAS